MKFIKKLFGVKEENKSNEFKWCSFKIKGAKRKKNMLCRSETKTFGMGLTNEELETIKSFLIRLNSMDDFDVMENIIYVEPSFSENANVD